jgi:hypothetical protein
MMPDHVLSAPIGGATASALGSEGRPGRLRSRGRPETLRGETWRVGWTVEVVAPVGDEVGRVTWPSRQVKTVDYRSHSSTRRAGREAHPIERGEGGFSHRRTERGGCRRDRTRNVPSRRGIDCILQGQRRRRPTRRGHALRRQREGREGARPPFACDLRLGTRPRRTWSFATARSDGWTHGSCDVIVASEVTATPTKTNTRLRLELMES